MKKFGQLMACFLPLIGFLFIQVVVSIVGSVILTTKIMLTEGVTDPFEVSEMLLQSDVLMSITIASQVICFIVFLIFYITIFKIRKPENPVKVFGPASPFIVIFLFIGLEALISTLLIVMQGVLPDLMQEYAEMIEKSGLADMTVLSTIATLVMAPLGEELAFRGMTLNLAGRFTKKFWIANIIQALMFGIAHMNLVQGTYAFVLGLFLGFLYKKYNSLYATILAHLTFNFAGTYLVGPLFGESEEPEVVRVILIAAVAAVLVAGAIIALIKDKKTSEREPMYMQRIHFRPEKQPVPAYAPVYGTMPGAPGYGTMPTTPVNPNVYESPVGTVPDNTANNAAQPTDTDQ